MVNIPSNYGKVGVDPASKKQRDLSGTTSNSPEVFVGGVPQDLNQDDLYVSWPRRRERTPPDLFLAKSHGPREHFTSEIADLIDITIYNHWI